MNAFIKESFKIGRKNMDYLFNDIKTIIGKEAISLNRHHN